MNRRSLLKSGAIISGIGIADFSLRKYTSPAYTVRFYQTDTLQTQLREHNMAEDRFLLQADEAISYLEEFFSISVDVQLSYTVIPASDVFSQSVDADSTMARMKYLANWHRYNKPDDDGSSTINMLISDVTNLYAGIAEYPIFPSCCSPFDKHSIVFTDLNSEDMFHRLVLHELGHNIGLQHYHGCNSDDGTRSVMLSNSYAKTAPKNIFGQPVHKDPKSQPLFNPALQKNHLRDF